jgi:hypothetical protein
MTKKIIMVMGVQRSGTNALFHSLAGDPSLAAYNEKEYDEFYDFYLLRPEPEIRHLFLSIPGTLLLKPISESFKRSPGKVFDEYAGYDLHIVWIYRDPVNVFYSGVHQGWYGLHDYKFQTWLWNYRNKKLLTSLPRYHKQITIIRYDELIADQTILARLYKRLGVQGKNDLHGDSNAGRKSLPEDIQQHIENTTRPVLTALDDARTYKSSSFSRVMQKWLSRPQPIGPQMGIYSPDKRSSTFGAGLTFHLSAQSLPGHQPGQSVTSWRDDGPHHLLPLPSLKSTSYSLDSISGKASVDFENSSGLCYTVDDDWAFLYDGRPFTLFMMCKPEIHPNPSNSSTISMPLYIGASEHRGPAFRLLWDEASKTWSASILPNSEEPGDCKDVVITAQYEVSSKNEHEWYLVVCRHTPYAQGHNLALSVNSPTFQTGFKENISYPQPLPGKHMLQLGGAIADGFAPFSGQIAGLVIFKRALDDTERFDVSYNVSKGYVR